MEEQSGHKKQIIAALAVLIVIFAIVAAAAVAGGKKDTDTAHVHSDGTVHNHVTGESTAPEATHSDATYKDGTYKATGDYTSPGGSQEITVSVTLKDNVITATSATSGASDTESKEHQEEFIANYKDLVIGKKISDVKLSRVAGSSLTSQGFNDAIQQIETDAEA